MSAVTVDFASLLPQMTSLTVEAAVPERPTLAWTAAGDLSGSDYGVAVLGWTDDNTDVHRAFFVVPGATASPIQMPDLPASLAAFQPLVGETFNVSDFTFVQVEGRDYAEIISAGDFDPRVAAAGASGLPLRVNTDAMLTSTRD